MEYGKHLLHIVCRRCLCLSYPITGVRERTLQAEQDGLYWNVSAVCSKDWDFPIRLIAETDGARTVLGVPQPEPDGLRLRARLSNRSCPFSGQSAHPDRPDAGAGA
ncbi:MAG: hypothetical protein ACLU3I_07170 [Acutalibacteraceae bacterium]